MEKNKNTFSLVCIFALIFLIVFHFVNNYIWLSISKLPHYGCMPYHMVSSLKYLDILSYFKLKPCFLYEVLGVDFFYPPLFPFIASLTCLIFGKSTLVLVMSNLVFVAATFISLYLIGRKMGDIRIGVLAAYILSFYPIFFYISRTFLLEIALCSMVTITVLFLLYTEGFSKTRPSFILGLLLGFGMLTKQSYVVFVLGPVVFLFFGTYLHSDAQLRKKILINLLFSLFIGICISSLWYLRHIRQMFPVLINVVSDSGLVPYDIPLFSWRSFYFYFETFVNDQIVLFFFVLFIFAVLVMLIKKINRKLFYLFILWLVVPYFILTLFNNKFFYYTLPCLPAVALISSCGLVAIKRTWLRRILIVMVFLVGFFHFFSASYYSGNSFGPFISVGKLKLRFFPFGMQRISLSYTPVGGEWNTQEIINKVVLSAKGESVVVGVYNIDHNLFGKKKGFITDNYICADFDYLNYSFMLNNVDNCQIIDLLHQENYYYLKNEVTYIISSILLENGNVNKINVDNYSLIYVFTMADGSKVYLYKINKLLSLSSGQ